MAACYNYQKYLRLKNFITQEMNILMSYQKSFFCLENKFKRIGHSSLICLILYPKSSAAELKVYVAEQKSHNENVYIIF